MSEINDAADRLKGAWSGLQDHWHTAKEHWRDAVGETFERTVWNEWEQEIPGLLKSLEDLDEILGQAIERTG